MTDLIIILVVAALVAFAGRYVYKAKKKGAKCIGCPVESCPSKGGGCAGCSGCPGGRT